jgi:hypothetical protein
MLYHSNIPNRSKLGAWSTATTVPGLLPRWVWKVDYIERAYVVVWCRFCDKMSCLGRFSARNPPETCPRCGG